VEPKIRIQNHHFTVTPTEIILWGHIGVSAILCMTQISLPLSTLLSPKIRE